MSGDIEIKEGKASPPSEVLISQPKPNGWIAWYRYTPDGYFNQVYGNFDYSRRNFHRCPSPLFESREEAIEAARLILKEQGGEVRVVRVEL